MKTHTSASLSAVGLALALGFASPSLAAPTPPPATTAPAAKTAPPDPCKAAPVAKDGRLKVNDVQDLGCLEVDGKPQRPSVHYILGRSAFVYRGLNLRRSFLGSILESTRSNQF